MRRNRRHAAAWRRAGAAYQNRRRESVNISRHGISDSICQRGSEKQAKLNVIGGVWRASSKGGYDVAYLDATWRRYAGIIVVKASAMGESWRAWRKTNMGWRI